MLLCVLFTQSPTDTHLGCFQFSAIMNKAALNIHIQVFVWTCFHLSWLKYLWQVYI